MFKVATLLLALVASATAFTAPTRSVRPRSAVKMELTEGIIAPTGKFDPLGIMDMGSDASNAWMRHAEVKHGRVAMFAFVGFIVSANGIHLPGEIATGVSFESISKLKPLEQWNAVPALGQIQILTLLGCFELLSEMEKPHYMKGGKTGVIPLIFAAPQMKALSEEKKADLRLKELQNGRLAMVGIMGFFAASLTPGSVPALSSLF
eukprot:CAMPEP_0205915318 /NCGR_PEP_ID=MMETSP1325-20131115/7793_1 /ASSEMBLY_ACC=CAM_ASM_000708 /TAXON_ID=236786 /ORGANISM="Florenciella sp., Strain RCC1007" /LENGTH=205 /DNA_ID=CAMNT_0053282481 /DNA_START=57 /DNA_END=674 /DNA_ORIENTATION=+